MIETLLATLVTLAEAAADTPPPSITAWVSLITGSGGSLVVLGLWVKSLLSEKADMVEAHRKKDEDLLKITRECVACISASVSQHKLDEDFRQQLQGLLEEIRERLPD